MAYININDTTGDATAANQLTEIALLTSIDSKEPTLGQKPMSGSEPVVIASDQSGVPVKTEDGTGTPITSTTSGPKQGLDVNVINNTSSGIVDKTAFVYGTTSEQPVGGVYQDTSPILSAGTTGAVRLTQNRAFHTNLRNDSGTEIATVTNPIRTDPTGITTQPISAASLPLPTGAATSALQITANTSLASILTNQTNGTQIATFGTNPGIAFGAITLAAVAEQPVRSTVYTEQTTNAQRSIVSDNTFDNPFFGVGNVKITYFDSTGAGPFTETLAPNGTTAVNTVNTNICYIEKMEIVPLSNTTANAPQGVFGTITLWSATGATGTVIGTFSGTTNGHTEWAHHYVATGKTCRITSFDVSSSGNAAGEGSVFRMKVKKILGTNTSEQQISPYLSLEGVSTSTNQRDYQSPYPIQVVGPARITMYTTPNSTTSNIQRASFTWLEY